MRYSTIKPLVWNYDPGNNEWKSIPTYPSSYFSIEVDGDQYVATFDQPLAIDSDDSIGEIIGFYTDLESAKFACQEYHNNLVRSLLSNT